MAAIATNSTQVFPVLVIFKGLPPRHLDNITTHPPELKFQDDNVPLQEILRADVMSK